MTSITSGYRMSFAVCATALLLSACSRQPAEPVQVPAVTFDEQDFHRHIQVLASDEFEGRAPATAGETKTIEYIRDAFRDAGLAPANGDSYYQPVPMVEVTAQPQGGLAVKAGDAERRFKVGDETVVWTRRLVPEASIADSELVFVGYGIVAPEYGWNDYAGLDMKGKTAVILVNDPGYASGDAQLFTGKAMTYYGRWTYKYEEAARQGAAGAIVIHDTAPASYGWEVVRSGWTGPQLDKWSEDGNVGRTAIEGWVTYPAAQAMFDLAGLDLAQLQARAGERGFKPVSMQARASAGVSNTIRRSESANVLGLLRGTERPDEYVVYMGHWDHLGRDPELEGDQIYNGAVDNATGISALILMARVFAAHPPARSVVFFATTGEESGLLGSAYYAEHPLFPLERTAGVINMDALYEGGPTHDVAVIGHGASELEELLREAAQSQGRRVEADARPERGSFYRSDHFNFAKKGVPALYVKPGVDALEGGVAHGAAVHEAYGQHYHRPSDEYRADMDFRGALQDLELLFAVGYRLAQQDSWPEWYEGKEFRAVREASRQMRQR